MPVPSADVNVFFIPPHDSLDFFISSLSLDIPHLNSPPNDSLTCLSLACNPISSVSPFSTPHLPPDPPPSPLLVASAFPDAVPLPAQHTWDTDLQFLTPLNTQRLAFAKLQRKDPYLGLLIQYLQDPTFLDKDVSLCGKTKRWVVSIAKRAKLIDGILYYADEFMPDSHHFRIYVPSDTSLQRHLLYAYHNSPIGMHRGRDATYNSLSHDFYWRNMSKHVRKWVKCCPDCLKFKTLNQPHGPMQIRLFKHPFHTLGVDYVGDLPISPSGNKWILTAVCPFSNFLRAIPVPDKTATTAARALFDHIFLQYGFPTVLQSDRGGEFLNAVLYCLTKLLSIRHVYTSAFRPRLNGTTERVHRFLNSALGIFCEKQQERWEEFLQSAVYSHNASPISGITDITPFCLVFGRNAPSPETVSLDLPPLNLSPDHFAYNLVQRMKEAHTLFFSIKSDLRRRQRELYDLTSRDITVPDGKLVYMRKESHSSISGQKPRFLRNFDGPFLVTGHPHDRSDLLHLRHISSGKDWPHPVNIEKIIVIPDISPSDISPADTINNADDTLALDRPKQLSIIHPNPDLAEVAYRLGQYLSSIPSKSSIASQACKYIYESYPSSREILAKHGKLRGLVKSCPFLNLEGASHGGVYILSLNSDLFERFRV